MARPRGASDRQLLHHVQTVLAVELLKRRAVAEAERRLAGDLVESVLAGEVGERGAAPRGARPSACAASCRWRSSLLRPAQRGTPALAELADDAGALRPGQQSATAASRC